MRKLTTFVLTLFLYSHLAFGVEGNIPKLLKEFEAYAEEQRKAWEIPGMAIAIIKGNEILLSKGFGQRGLSDPRPVDEDTLFQIGSLTKAFTSALVAMAVDRNQLKWTDKVIFLILLPVLDPVLPIKMFFFLLLHTFLKKFLKELTRRCLKKRFSPCWI